MKRPIKKKSAEVSENENTEDEEEKVLITSHNFGNAYLELMRNDKTVNHDDH